jgi:ADP-heptose:LPS heptosyltransferase
MVDHPPQSPLRGKYLVRNPALNRLLSATDRLLGLLPSPRRAPRKEAPRRILLANGAHLGDVLLSLSLVPILRDAFPQARLGFLAGSWAQGLLKGHAELAWVHYLDHWKLNRSPVSLGEKLRRHSQTRRRALREIRACRYDVALDLYYYFPNSIPLLWQASIPCRIGYTSGGFGPLLTHALDWRLRDQHVTDYQMDLLHLLDVPANHLHWRAPALAAGKEQLPRQLLAGLARAGIPPAGYVVFHLGTAAALKEWPILRWRQLAMRMNAEGRALLFTGSAGREWQNAQQVSAGLKLCVNLCGGLNWQEFVEVLRQAELLVGVDSVAGHIAASVATPCVVISSGIANLAHWKPRGAPCRVLSHPVACAPCYRSRGCEGMECVRQVRVGQVHAVIREALDASARQGA